MNFVLHHGMKKVPALISNHFWKIFTVEGKRCCIAG
ncbi:MAG: hypothetical protein JWR26_2680 [Pedosphaera sp.]|nr:hypothetical protein [Pedosphaera sp.]